jgi:F-type H+-transporting ATPase subunit alpha
MSLDKEVTILYAATSGHLDDVPVAKISAFEQAFHYFMETSHPDIGKLINADKMIKPETEELLKKAIAEFKKSASY